MQEFPRGSTQLPALGRAFHFFLLGGLQLGHCLGFFHGFGKGLFDVVAGWSFAVGFPAEETRLLGVEKGHLLCNSKGWLALKVSEKKIGHYYSGKVGLGICGLWVWKRIHEKERRRQS